MFVVQIKNVAMAEYQDKRELVTNCDQLQDNEGDVEFRKRLAEGLRNGTFMTVDEYSLRFSASLSPWTKGMRLPLQDIGHVLQCRPSVCCRSCRP